MSARRGIPAGPRDCGTANFNDVHAVIKRVPPFQPTPRMARRRNGGRAAREADYRGGRPGPVRPPRRPGIRAGSARRGIPAGPRDCGTANFNDVCIVIKRVPPLQPTPRMARRRNGGRAAREADYRGGRPGPVRPPRRPGIRAGLAARRGIPAGTRDCGAVIFNDTHSYKTNAPLQPTPRTARRRNGGRARRRSGAARGPAAAIERGGLLSLTETELTGAAHAQEVCGIRQGDGGRHAFKG